MRKTTSWVATLALAALPTVAQAGPFGLFGGSKPAAETARPASGSPNEIAQSVADELRAAQLQGRDIDIEYYRGTVTLSGIIADSAQRARATEAASRVAGVQNVVNQMRVAGPIAAAAARGPVPGGGIIQASNETTPIPLVAPRPSSTSPAVARTPVVEPAVSLFSETAPAIETPSGPSNQQVAQQIATALSQQNLTGYDIQIRYQNGTAALGGSVATREQWESASRAASTVPGVDRVVNRMRVGGPPQTATRSAATDRGGVPVRSVGYRQDPPMPGDPNGGAPVAPPAGWVPPQPPQSYGHPGAGMAHQAYSTPNLPNYAWPAQAAYPNSAQISYPQQYSASAWPYIGPFYPYPQVPLGWREAQLEWDDGYWQLNFKPRTSKWFWFANPRNWN